MVFFYLRYKSFNYGEDLSVPSEGKANWVHKFRELVQLVTTDWKLSQTLSQSNGSASITE